MYDSIFIDLDGTLWDIHKNGQECLRRMFYDYGFDKFYPTFQDYYDVYITLNEHLWLLYRQGKIQKDELTIERFLAPLREFGIDDPLYAKKLSRDFLHRTTMRTALVEGAIEILEYLQPKYRLHIVSNGFRDVQHAKLRNSKLRKFFDKIILSEDAESNKPHPKMFTYALVNTNSRRKSTLMIGDCWETDIVGAHNSHIAQLWFNPQKNEATTFTPTFEVERLVDIKNFL